MQLAGLQSNKAVINFDRNVAEAQKPITIEEILSNPILIDHDLGVSIKWGYPKDAL